MDVGNARHGAHEGVPTFGDYFARMFIICLATFVKMMSRGCSKDGDLELRGNASQWCMQWLTCRQTLTCSNPTGALCSGSH